mmetsp:Transcript_15599/g.31089  ORF Transcript_15599/g.31089 Transcript_15599/m.31089 type:complete len:211 (+) Transcript_15599:1680-2312(+)
MEQAEVGEPRTSHAAEAGRGRQTGEAGVDGLRERGRREPDQTEVQAGAGEQPPEVEEGRRQPGGAEGGDTGDVHGPRRERDAAGRAGPGHQRRGGRGHGGGDGGRRRFRRLAPPPRRGAPPGPAPELQETGAEGPPPRCPDPDDLPRNKRHGRQRRRGSARERGVGEATGQMEGVLDGRRRGGRGIDTIVTAFSLSGHTLRRVVHGCGAP